MNQSACYDFFPLSLSQTFTEDRTILQTLIRTTLLFESNYTLTTTLSIPDCTPHHPPVHFSSLLSFADVTLHPYLGPLTHYAYPLISVQY